MNLVLWFLARSVDLNILGEYRHINNINLKESNLKNYVKGFILGLILVLITLVVSTTIILFKIK